MDNNIKINLGEIHETLMIPLWGRANELENPEALIRDSFAHELIGKPDSPERNFLIIPALGLKITGIKNI